MLQTDRRIDTWPKGLDCALRLRGEHVPGGRAIYHDLVKRILLAAPRGYCAGVERAIEAVERALGEFGSPVFVRRQIVHNRHVVADLEAKGAVFVDDEREVPVGSVTVFSAHGVTPAVHDNAARRGLSVIDATCPLVTKVHREASRFARRDVTILLIGHAGHDEVIGTAGHAPGRTILVQTAEDASEVQVHDPERVAYVCQTTLSVNDTAEIVEILRRRFPSIQAPPSDDICYATQNRQEAVKAVAGGSDVVLVVGSANSSNSNRLVEVARSMGVPAHLIEDEGEIDAEWLHGARTVGVTAGASAPEPLVERVVARLRAWGATEPDVVRVAEEHLVFAPPLPLRHPGAASAFAGGGSVGAPLV
jgi:4-hydroxy-3-methylbut-2-enyl diphosphate reductase